MALGGAIPEGQSREGNQVSRSSPLGRKLRFIHAPLKAETKNPPGGPSRDGKKRGRKKGGRLHQGKNKIVGEREEKKGGREKTYIPEVGMPPQTRKKKVTRLTPIADQKDKKGKSSA